ncbi:hypothetical protein [Klebsiella phage vB_KpnP-VAC71]|uniref:Uncharacterized protein n=1 Tax=Klebsiella phage vB_KpnP-VAC71 TaxID=2866700 RepID=A0AAE8YE91_9CAUD|nr:hypothetical protein [Klebsiella phage vB_KpnP-VAC71]
MRDTTLPTTGNTSSYRVDAEGSQVVINRTYENG